MTPSRAWRGWALGALVLASSAGCRPEDQRTETLDPQGEQTRAQLPPDVVAQLDSGTVAYRGDRFEDALAHYARVTELAPSVAAGWFGVYMVQHRLGNAAAADSALARAQGTAPGASLIHPTAADTIG
jgi:hypothetical protein